MIKSLICTTAKLFLFFSITCCIKPVSAAQAEIQHFTATKEKRVYYFNACMTMEHKQLCIWMQGWKVAHGM